MIIPHFEMNLHGWHVIKWKITARESEESFLYLFLLVMLKDNITAKESEESFLCLLLFVMLKNADLSDFDKAELNELKAENEYL